MGIFDRFPYSSTHEMNLDFMLGKATEIAESLQEIDTHKDQAEQAATNAAQSAQSATQAAQAAAGSQTAAGTSASQAAQHKADAEDAADRAEAASDLADEAVEQAQTAATNASTAADGAIASATAAETRINNLAASLPTDFTDLNNKVNNLDEAVIDIVRSLDVNMIDIIGFESGYFYEWNTGTRRQNANWGNIKIPISQGETVLFKTPGTKSIHLTRWLNGAYVSGYSSGSVGPEYKINGSEAYDEIIISSEISSLEAATIEYINNVNKVFYINPGDSIKEILTEAIKTYGSTVYINPGTYDLIEEYGGTATIDSGSVATFGRGIVVGNGVKIISTPAAKIVCNYTGTNTDFKTYFSPFTAHDENNSAMNGYFEIVGLNIEASNCRYAFHDDLGFATTKPYRHVFKDCHFAFDNSGNTAWNGDQCIGGGLGDYGLIEIYNCEFETVQTRQTECNDVSYHANARGTNPLTESNVYIKDCWFSHTFSARYYNTYTTISHFYMSNCSVSQAPYVRAETPQSTVVNVALKAWNNNIRN